MYTTSHETCRHAQKGAALIMALIFLLILTILGVTAMGTSTLEEKMAGNAKEQNLAFQSAEAALLVAENWIKSQTSIDFPNNSIGLYEKSPTAIEVWDSIDWNGSGVVTYPGVPGAAATGTLGDVSTMPKYIIEAFSEMEEEGGTKVVDSSFKGKTNKILRITARGTGGTDNAVSMVQSSYIASF